VCINTAGGYTCSCTEGYWLVAGHYGSFMCNCDEGFELAADGTTCIDLDECGFSEYLCQHRCVNTPGSFSCVCPPGYYVFEDERSCEDINECDTGNNTCTTAQVCFNFQGGFTCLDPLQCESPYIEVADNQCMCSAENRECQDKPFTILYRHMDLSSGRTVPADIFQMQATTRYPGAFYIFKVKSGDGERVFYMRVESRSPVGPRTSVSTRSGAAMECLKMCCKNYMGVKDDEPEKQDEVLMYRDLSTKKSVRVSEDYLLSKMPSDGREVPFVLPTFQPTYVQPRGTKYPSVQPGPQSSAVSRYAERKAELSVTDGPVLYGRPEAGLHPDQLAQLAQFMSPGSARRDTLQQNQNSVPQVPVCELKAGQQRLSSSMMDLSSPLGRMQRFDSVSSVQSSGSSMNLSMQSSLESIGLSGDECDQGKVCVRVSYQEALEQVWISLIQCSDLSVPVDRGDQQQRIRFKGVITTAKPVQFKSSIKDYVPDVMFMETFVFALRLQRLRSSALVLRLQAHSPRKRAVAQCVLPLRQLGPQETEHWLDLRPPSKASVCHAELHVATCFQAVSGRVQLQVIAANNLPAASTPLSQVFFVKAELQWLQRPPATKKTKALKASDGACQWAESFHFQLPSLDHAPALSLKLYSRSSVRRKQCLGEVVLGVDSPVVEAAEQWKNTLAQPEISVAAWHRLSRS
ncbi:hypothetical protein NHX12_019989, partial [Muraenolepis orangiensis]